MPNPRHRFYSRGVVAVFLLTFVLQPGMLFAQDSADLADDAVLNNRQVAVEETLAEEEEIGDWGTIYKSKSDGLEYDFLLNDQIMTISIDSVVVARLPEDVFARVGMLFYDTSFAPDATIVGFFVDPDTGKMSFKWDGAIVDVVLGLLTLIFAFAFVVTGYFLLRVARERRTMHEGRIRQLRAREAERTHLAAELHDGPVQDLQYVMRSYFGMLPVARSGETPELKEIQSRLESVSAALRNICTELRPPVLAHFGLAYAIRQYSEKYGHRLPDTKIHVEVNGDETVDSEELSLSFYRIFQESLSNIEKHSEASNVWVELQIDTEWAELVVRDDGKGFVLPKSLDHLEADGHLGLAGLSQRAEAVGGAFDVRSTPGVGTTIRVVAKRLPTMQSRLVAEGTDAI